MPNWNEKVSIRRAKWCTPFLIANRHLFSSDRQIALVSSAGIPLRQRSPHIDIVHLYKARGIENRHSAPRWHWSQNLGYWISMLKLNAPAGIHRIQSNMNKRDPILMQYVEVLKDCRSLNAADEMNCPMPRSVEKVPVRNEKRCSKFQLPSMSGDVIDLRSQSSNVTSQKCLWPYLICRCCNRAKSIQAPQLPYTARADPAGRFFFFGGGQPGARSNLGYPQNWKLNGFINPHPTGVFL